MKYKCKVKGCDYETDNRYGIAGHIGGHKKRGEFVKTEPPKQPATPVEIANALLNTVVDAINKEQSLQEQLREAKRRIASLTEDLARTTVERDRVIKLHNEQVEAARKHGVELPSTDTLMRIAKIRKPEGS